MSEQLRIAIPNKGRLSEKIYELLSNAGLNFPSKSERTLQVTTRDGKYSLIFVRTQDIPRFVEDGVADIGFTGFDIVTEEKVDVDKIMEAHAAPSGHFLDRSRCPCNHNKLYRDKPAFHARKVHGHPRHGRLLHKKRNRCVYQGPRNP